MGAICCACMGTSGIIRLQLWLWAQVFYWCWGGAASKVVSAKRTGIIAHFTQGTPTGVFWEFGGGTYKTPARTYFCICFLSHPAALLKEQDKHSKKCWHQEVYSQNSAAPQVIILLNAHPPPSYHLLLPSNFAAHQLLPLNSATRTLLALTNLPCHPHPSAVPTLSPFYQYYLKPSSSSTRICLHFPAYPNCHHCACHHLNPLALTNTPAPHTHTPFPSYGHTCIVFKRKINIVGKRNSYFGIW